MLWSRLSGSRFERSAQWLSIAQSATGVERNKLLEIAAELGAKLRGRTDRIVAGRRIGLIVSR